MSKTVQKIAKRAADHTLVDYMSQQQSTSKEEGDIGNPSMNKCNGHVSRPSHLPWRLPQRSTIDPLVCQRYLFSRCLLSIAMYVQYQYKKTDTQKI